MGFVMSKLDDSAASYLAVIVYFGSLKEMAKKYNLTDVLGVTVEVKRVLVNVKIVRSALT